MDLGFTFLKMDLGLMQIADMPGAVVAPAGSLEGFRSHAGARPGRRRWRSAGARNAVYDVHNVRHPFTGLHFTDKGLDLLEQYIAEVREVIGYGDPARHRPRRPYLAAERHPARAGASRNTCRPGWRT